MPVPPQITLRFNAVQEFLDSAKAFDSIPEDRKALAYDQMVDRLASQVEGFVPHSMKALYRAKAPAEVSAYVRAQADYILDWYYTTGAEDGYRWADLYVGARAHVKAALSWMQGYLEHFKLRAPTPKAGVSLLLKSTSLHEHERDTLRILAEEFGVPLPDDGVVVPERPPFLNPPPNNSKASKRVEYWRRVLRDLWDEQVNVLRGESDFKVFPLAVHNAKNMRDELGREVSLVKYRDPETLQTFEILSEALHLLNDFTSTLMVLRTELEPSGSAKSNPKFLEALSIFNQTVPPTYTEISRLRETLWLHLEEARVSGRMTAREVMDFKSEYLSPGVESMPWPSLQQSWGRMLVLLDLAKHTPASAAARLSKSSYTAEVILRYIPTAEAAFSVSGGTHGEQSSPGGGGLFDDLEWENEREVEDELYRKYLSLTRGDRFSVGGLKFRVLQSSSGATVKLCALDNSKGTKSYEVSPASSVSEDRWVVWEVSGASGSRIGSAPKAEGSLTIEPTTLLNNQDISLCASAVKVLSLTLDSLTANPPPGVNDPMGLIHHYNTPEHVAELVPVLRRIQGTLFPGSKQWNQFESIIQNVLTEAAFYDSGGKF